MNVPRENYALLLKVQEDVFEALAASNLDIEQTMPLHEAAQPLRQAPYLMDFETPWPISETREKVNPVHISIENFLILCRVRFEFHAALPEKGKERRALAEAIKPLDDIILAAVIDSHGG